MLLTEQLQKYQIRPDTIMEVQLCLLLHLPQDIFSAAGFDLNELAPGNYHDGFGQGLAQLIAIAHAHLKDALAYTRLIPKNETGIREFCLWAIGMAMLTLRKINQHRDFTSGRQVKISRRSVKATILTSHLTVGNNLLLTAMFQLMGLSLPALTTSLAPSKANVND